MERNKGTERSLSQVKDMHFETSFSKIVVAKMSKKLSSCYLVPIWGSPKLYQRGSRKPLPTAVVSGEIGSE